MFLLNPSPTSSDWAGIGSGRWPEGRSRLADHPQMAKLQTQAGRLCHAAVERWLVVAWLRRGGLEVAAP